MTNTQKNLKFITYIGLAILLYIPFIVSDSLFFPFVTGKAFTFRIVTEIIIAIWLILAVLNPIFRPKKNFILYTFLAFVISLFVSNMNGINPFASFWSNFERMEGWVTIAHLFGLFIALGSILKDKKEWLAFFNISIVFGLIMSLYAFGDIFEKGFNYRVNTNLGNSTYLAIYMLFNAFLSLFFLLRQKISFTGWYSWFYFISFVLQSIIIFQTGTRGSMLGLLGGLLLMSLIIFISSFKNNKTESKLFKKAALVIAGFVLVFLGTVFSLKDSNFVQDSVALNRISSISISEGTAAARITNWKIATEGFKERPVLGWGQSNFNYVFDKYYLPEHYGNETWFDRVHNIFFDWLIAGGILGLLFYLSIWVTSLYYLYKSEKLEVNEKAVLVSLLAAYFFHNLFVFDQIVSYIYFVLFISFIYSQSNDLDSEENQIFKENLSKGLKKGIVWVIIIGTIFSIYKININSINANKDLISAIQITKKDSAGETIYYHEKGIEGNIEKFKTALNKNTIGKTETSERVLMTAGTILSIQNLDNSTKQEYVNFVVEVMKDVIKNDPYSSRANYLFGTFYAQTNQIGKAEEFLLKAIELSPNKQGIRVPLIRIYATTNQTEKAINLARETYKLDESKDNLWVEYSKVLSKFDNESFEALVAEALENKKFKRVEKLLLESLSIDPSDINKIKSLSSLYIKIDEKEKALSLLRKSSEKFPEIKDETDFVISQIESLE